MITIVIIVFVSCVLGSDSTKSVDVETILKKVSHKKRKVDDLVSDTIMLFSRFNREYRVPMVGVCRNLP